MLHLEVVFVIGGEFSIPMGVNSTAPSQWTSKFRFGGSDVPIVGAVFGKSCHIDLAISPRPGSLPKILDCVNDAPPVLGLVCIWSDKHTIESLTQGIWAEHPAHLYNIIVAEFCLQNQIAVQLSLVGNVCVEFGVDSEGQSGVLITHGAD